MRYLLPILAVLVASAPAMARNAATPRQNQSQVANADSHGFLLDDDEIEELMRIPGDDTPVASPPPSESGTQGTVWRIELRDGQVLRGRVVTASRDEVVVELAPGARTTLSRAVIANVTADDAAPAATTARPAPRPASSTAPSGQPGPRTQEVSQQPSPRPGAAHVAAPGSPGRSWFTDPNRTRHLYVPSGMMFRQGEGSVSQKELFFTSFNYGLTDWLSVQVGGVVPIWFLDGGFNLIGGLKVGGEVLKNVHLAAGAQNLVMAPAGVLGTLGIGFGNVTFGNPDIHATLTVGVPWMVNLDATEIGTIIFAASGTLRVSEHVALVTENWMFPMAFQASDGFTHIIGAAVRLMNQNLSADIGFLVVPHVPLPVPWLSGTWNFQL